MDPKWPIFNLPKYGAGPGPQRTLELCQDALQLLKSAQTPILKVTGSNGKGSTVAYIEQAACALDLKIGVLTSPHMFDPAERIRIQGVPVLDFTEAQTRVLHRISAYQDRWPEDTVCQSDALLALALDLFVQEKCALICLEAGLGGRLDPVRWTPGRHMALTSIDLEHRDALGGREDLILSEKIELCPDGGVCAASSLQDDLGRKLAAWAQMRNVCLLDHSEMLSALSEAPITQIGSHQRENAALALTLLADCLKSTGLWPGQVRYFEACRTSLLEVALPGRLRKQSIEDVPIWLDAAHTPRAMRAYAAAVQPQLPCGQAVMIIGVSLDKCLLELLVPIIDCAAEICCVTPAERGTPTSQLAKTIRSLRPAIRIHHCDSLAEGLAFGLDIAKEKGLPVCIAGGLFLAREMETELKTICFNEAL